VTKAARRGENRAAAVHLTSHAPSDDVVVYAGSASARVTPGSHSPICSAPATSAITTRRGRSVVGPLRLRGSAALLGRIQRLVLEQLGLPTWAHDRSFHACDEILASYYVIPAACLSSDAAAFDRSSGLPLQDRCGRLRRRYRVGVPMCHPPAIVFQPEDRGDSQST
jgi:hypothetical protein